MSTSTSTTTVEPMYVLYGSQTGNSEQYAKLFCSKLQGKFTDEFFKEQGLMPSVKVETTCIQLDDFLEMRHAAFTKCVVIFVSSYGVGQAPLGSYRFREVCDAFSEGNHKDALKGLKYAICGLGDSSYPTYLQNPKAIDAGLSAAGAQRIGEMAEADADGLRDKGQDATIRRWIEGIWVPLAKAICSSCEGGEQVDTKAMQANTIPILLKLDPDYTPPKELLPDKGAGGSGGICPPILGLAGLSLVVIAVAIAAASSLK